MNEMSQNTDEASKGRTPNAWMLAFMGTILMWLSFPPAGIWPLAWIALTPWCWLILSPELNGRRPYLAIWLAGFVYWLATNYFVPIPHPLLWIGWVVLGAYLSLYQFLFIPVSRSLVHRFKLPAIVVIPGVYAGVEFLRSNYIVAFGTILLGNTQVEFPLLIQTADLFGGYTVTFFLAMFSACVATIWFRRGKVSEIAAPSIVGIAVLVFVIGYGYWRINEDKKLDSSPVVKLALIQGSIDAVLPPTEEMLEKKALQYQELTLKARSEVPDLDLIVWPESAFSSAYLLPFDPDKIDESDAELAGQYAEAFQYVWYQSIGLDPPYLIAGTASEHLTDSTIYNTGVLINPAGQVEEVYHKQHLVIMGEFVPLARQFPALQKMFPIGRGFDRGRKAKAFQVNGLNFVPNICFESTVPHLIRKHVLELAAQNKEPDFLVNITNDGWFFGTACLDHHLASNMMRAVEMRKPMLVAANTGLSAVIDSNGQLQLKGPRRDTAILYADVAREKQTWSLYRNLGDWVPWSLGMLVLLVAIFEFGSFWTASKSD